MAEKKDIAQIRAAFFSCFGLKEVNIIENRPSLSFFLDECGQNPHTRALGMLESERFPE